MCDTIAKKNHNMKVTGRKKIACYSVHILLLLLLGSCFYEREYLKHNIHVCANKNAICIHTIREMTEILILCTIQAQIKLIIRLSLTQFSFLSLVNFLLLLIHADANRERKFMTDEQ